MKTKVLDHGYLELLDIMGSDADIAAAARVSVREAKTRSDDESLIRFLMRHGHTSPFEMAELKFRVKLPIFVARQWVRHRTASLNEISGRYSELPEECYIPEPDHVRKQGASNKQCSGELADYVDADYLRDRSRSGALSAWHKYRDFIGRGIARETARIHLPLSTYTEWIWKCDLHNILHFLSKRLASDAQYEIRVYAEAMAEIVKSHFPITWQAFEDFRLNAMTLSAIELEALRATISGAPLPDFPTKRERSEWREKLEKVLKV